MTNVNITINNKKLSLESGYTIIQACEIANIEIPRFCYHERLAIAGNCRMCLVEVEGSPPKPVASCAMPIAEGMVIHTDSEKVRKAREGVLEFLLINHPLDCPICDQAGECDLQDQALLYGRGVSRFHQYKRVIPDKNLGPLIATAMNRCIHCTRCIRFLSDIAGSDELGAIGRGEDMEISTYIEKSINSELSGNIIDLCPVGALLSKPFSFTARPWELRHVETIDVLDAVGSAIHVDYKDRSVMRILPRLNDEINEEWISDKTRFAYDGLRLQRLDRPYIRKGGILKKCSWGEAFAFIAEKINRSNKEKISAIVGDLVDVESILMLRNLMQELGAGNNLECRQYGEYFDVNSIKNKIRATYLFNSSIAGIEESDFCLLIGSNPRIEAPIINARLRKRYLQGNKGVNKGSSEGFIIAEINPAASGTAKTRHIFKTIDLGNNLAILQDILEILETELTDEALGERSETNMATNAANNIVKTIAQKMQRAQKPMMIIGQDVLIREDASYVISLLQEIAEKFGFIKEEENWNGFNILHKHAGRVGALDLGFVSAQGAEYLCKNSEIIYLLGADEIVEKIPKEAFVIYQGHHGDKGANRADVILPGAAYTEKDATYVNTEGRAQHAFRAVFPPGEAIEDWHIIVKLGQYLNIDLKANNIEEVRELLAKEGPQFQSINHLIENKWKKTNFNGKREFSSPNSFLQAKPFNFYMTDPISRASKIMALCSKELTEA